MYRKRRPYRRWPARGQARIVARNLPNRGHSSLTHTLGSVVALIVMIPVTTWVVFDVATSRPSRGVATNAMPGILDHNPATMFGQRGGNNAAPGAPAHAPRAGRRPGGARQPACASSICIIKMEAGANGAYVFNPSTLSVKAGATITFRDIGGVVHNIVPDPTFKDPATPIDRADYNAKDYTVKLARTGVFHYRCVLHLPSMVGQITVT